MMDQNLMNQMNLFNQFGPNNLMPMENLFNNNFRIQNIVSPYEEKIKELEEKLRQKDFEIACLKDNINQQNMTSQMNMMNQMNMMMQMQMMNEPSEKQITLNFQKKDELNNQQIKCSYDELVISVINKYCRRNDIEKDNYTFIYNTKKLNENLTVSECGLTDNSFINIFKKNSFNTNKVKGNEIIKDNSPRLNIVFLNTSGIRINIKCKYNETIRDAIKKYLIKMDLDEDVFINKKIMFLFNAQLINPRSDITIKEFFNGNHSPSIIVNDTKGLLGN